MGHNHIGKHNKNMILMLICCLIPIAGIVILMEKDIIGIGNAKKGDIEM